ncbi:MAG: UDP-N-acetylmuramate--L-alanine ligase [Lachnospiraceae bacterium]|nr:UDP-N-acetylmuramate--L-alanine ligase [Lachnospiraceae bacterium]
MYKVDFTKPIHVHFIGIGGISMSGLAEILIKEGFKITGSDMKASEITRSLEDMGAFVYVGQRASNIDDKPDLVVYTAAIHQDNEEYKACVDADIPMLTRAELLGQIMDNYKFSVAVSGTHGKTTTTSMLSHIFIEADVDPTISVGGMLDAIGGNIRVGHSDYFVTEACEYTNSYHKFFPDTSIILNVDADHLDFFKDINEIVESFHTFAGNLKDTGTLVINGDMESFEKVTKDLNCGIITFGESHKNDYYPTDIETDENGHISFTANRKGEVLGRVSLNVGGVHNVTNALSAIAVAIHYGIDFDTCVAGLSSFAGAKRRFERKGERMGVTVIDDYAHHPTEIKATLKAARRMVKNELWLVFQPHTYTRTKALFGEFVDALTLADHIVLADIYAAREKDTGLVHASELRDELVKRGKDAHYFPTFNEIENFLLKNCKKNDLLITMGAGDVVNIGEELLGM